MKLFEIGKDMKISTVSHSFPLKVWGTFFLKKLCIGGTNFFWVILWGGLLYMGTNGQIIQGTRKSFKCIFQKSEHCKSEKFPRPWWETYLKINPNHSTELWKDLSLKFTVKRFQRSSQVQFLSC